MYFFISVIEMHYYTFLNKYDYNSYFKVNKLKNTSYQISPTTYEIK